MFDRIVERTDADQRRRSAWSLAVTTSLVGAGIVGFVVGSVLYVVTPTSEPVKVGIVAMAEPQGGGEPKIPDAPMPRAHAPSGEADPDAEPTATPTPQTDPHPTPSGTSTDGSPDAGTGGGTGGGDTDQHGTPDGEGDGPEVHVYQHTQLEVKHRVDLRYPEAARSLGLGEQRCLANVRVDSEGVPYEVEVLQCPEAFQQETRATLLKWRFYPARDGHVRVAAETSVGVVFRLTDDR